MPAERTRVKQQYQEPGPDLENILRISYKKWRNNLANYKQTAATRYDIFIKNVNKNFVNLTHYITLRCKHKVSNDLLILDEGKVTYDIL